MRDFLAGGLPCTIRSPEGSRYCPVSASVRMRTPVQPPIPSGGGSFAARSLSLLSAVLRNIKRISIRFPFRVPVRSRLTLERLALSRKPGACGAHVSACVIVTHAYIFFSGRSSISHDTPSTPTGMLPYHSHHKCESLASAIVLMPDHHPRVTARLVSCYALFK